MGVGKSRIVDLHQDAAEIFVANPRVANAVVRTTRKLYIIGMDAGQTSVYALDKQGRQIAAFEISIGRDIGELQQILHAAMPSAAITARTVNDTIILTGAVDSAEEAQRAGDIAKGFVQWVYGGGGGDRNRYANRRDRLRHARPRISHPQERDECRDSFGRLDRLRGTLDDNQASHQRSSGSP
jgi:pilus assembly protein CpaC